MPLPIQEFFAGAQNRVIPNSTNQQTLQFLQDGIAGSVDFTPQTCVVEYGTSFLSLSVTATPQFTFPANLFDQTTAYEYIGVRNRTNPSVITQNLDVGYPGVAQPFRESYSVSNSSMRNLLTSGPASGTVGSRQGRPMVVYPSGVLVVEQSGDSLGGDQFDLVWLRMVCGAPGRVRNESPIVAAVAQ